MAKILLEDACGEFRVNRAAGNRGVITETTLGGSPLYRVPGRFSICGKTNGNGRRYSLKVWENNLKNPSSKLRKLIEKNAAFGLLEHPDDGRVNLQSPIAVITTKAELVQENGDTVVEGELVIVNTSEGLKLKALIEAGYDPFVSSRGFGSLVKANDGIDDVQEDYVCEGWDVVYQPSFEQAELRPPRAESVKEAAPLPPVPSASSTSPTVALAEGVETPKAPSPAAQPQPPSNAMNQKEIRAQLDSLKALTQGKPDSRAITESMGRCDTLHKEVALWLAEDNKNSWEAQKLHDEIRRIEDNLSSMQQAPVQEAQKLRENQVKLLQVTKLVSQKAVDFGKKLAESVTRHAKTRELSKKILERGQAWKARSEKLQEANSTLDFQLDVVSEACDRIVEQYNSDIVKLSRKLMAHKFGDKITPEIKERLEKATHPKHVYAIHEELSKTEPKPEEKPAETAPVKESKAPAAKSGSPTPTPAPTNEPKKIVEGVTVINAVRDPRSLSESVDIAKRLSAALVTA